MAQGLILMLEDDRERLDRFSAVLRQVDPSLGLQVWRDANVMVQEVGPFLSASAQISLDQDLEPESGGTDPGDGVAVAKFLVSQSIKRPTIIHSSNATRAKWMEGEFDLAGWRHWRVAPIGDDWIERDWRMVVQKILFDGHRRSSR